MAVRTVVSYGQILFNLVKIYMFHFQLADFYCSIKKYSGENVPSFEIRTALRTRRQAIKSLKGEHLNQVGYGIFLIAKFYFP